MTDEEFMAENIRLGHQLQTAIAMELEQDEGPLVTEHEKRFRKHLRVGIDSLFVGDLALARLLIAKGIFSDEEYKVATIDALAEEVERRRAGLSERLGINIQLI